MYTLDTSIDQVTLEKVFIDSPSLPWTDYKWVGNSTIVDKITSVIERNYSEALLVHFLELVEHYQKQEKRESAGYLSKIIKKLPSR